jgi:glutamyl-tRNA synthetase
LDGIGRSPARFDMAKLKSVNGHYLHEEDDERLAGLVAERLADMLGRAPDTAARERLRRGMGGLKQRAKTLVELAENACFYARTIPLPMSEKAARILDEDARTCLAALIPRFEALADWTEDGLAADVRAFADAQSPPMKLGKIAQPLRAALTGDTASPGIFEVLAVLGREEALARMRNVVK